MVERGMKALNKLDARSDRMAYILLGALMLKSQGAGELKSLSRVLQQGATGKLLGLP